MKKNKIKIFIISLFITLLLVGVFLIKNQNNTETNIPQIFEEVKDLPDLSQIDPNINPLLYDFINSSISYKMNVNPEKWGFYYAILQNKENPDVIYVEYYSHGEQITFPTLAGAPLQILLDQNEVNAIENFSKNMSNNRVFYEDNWKMLIISQYNDGEESDFNYCDSEGKWAGINLKSMIGQFPEGEMQKTIKSGSGWPIDWLRKNPYNESMKIEGYDVSNTFWDKYNINSYKIYTNNNGEKLKVEVVQLDRFKFEVDGYEVNLNEQQLQYYLNQEGWY